MIDQFNVAGLVPGTDPKLKDEVVIYSAHWDHLGKQGSGADTIYNGAVDNASGSAGLLAMAQEAAKAPAKRSQMFLWVAAEEQGLLGSAAYAASPLWPAGEDRGQPEPRQPQFRRRHARRRHARQRAHRTGRDGRSDRQGDGPEGGARRSRTWPAATSAATISASPSRASRRSRSRAGMTTSRTPRRPVPRPRRTTSATTRYRTNTMPAGTCRAWCSRRSSR